MRIRFMVSLLVIVLAAGFVGPLPTRAAGPGGDAAWGIVPDPNQDATTIDKGYFVYPMQADARVSGHVLLRNPGSTPVTIDLSTVTAQTAQNGGSAFATESGAVSGAASWIDLSEHQSTIAPGTERPIGFTVHTPAGLKPGQYLAGIAAAEVPVVKAAQAGAKPKLGAGVTMRKRYVIAVEADIAGAWQASLSIPKVSVLDQPSGSVIGVQLRNDGDMFLKPSGSILVSGAGGTHLISQTITLGTFVPGTEITYPVRWPGKPLAGAYTVAVKLNYAPGKTAIYNSTINVSPAVAQHAVEQANAASNAPQTAVQPIVMAAPVVGGIRPWMIYGIGALLLLLVILLGLNLRRRRPTGGAA